MHMGARGTYVGTLLDQAKLPDIIATRFGILTHAYLSNEEEKSAECGVP